MQSAESGTSEDEPETEELLDVGDPMLLVLMHSMLGQSGASGSFSFLVDGCWVGGEAMNRDDWLREKAEVLGEAGDGGTFWKTVFSGLADMRDDEGATEDQVSRFVHLKDAWLTIGGELAQPVHGFLRIDLRHVGAWTVGKMRVA